MESVYITGRGIVSPLGHNLAENEAGLRSGKSGIVRVPEFISHQLESEVGGLVGEISAGDIADRKKLRFCPPSSVMSIVAAAEAFAEAGIPADKVRDYRIAVIGGTASSYSKEVYEMARVYVDSNFRLRNVSPFAVPRAMPSSVVSNLSLVFGIRGESYGISAACATSALAVAIGARLIASGAYDMVLAGGAESLDWSQALGFCACRALSHKYNDEPERASRPFDRDRDGFVLAEGAAFMLLESERSLKARGARPITKISGVGANSNAVDMVVPDSAAICEVMKEAVCNAGLSPADIGYVNTHGTSTPVGDPLELNAVRKYFGDNIAINSTKSQTGHMVSATGAAEIIFTSLMLEKDFISPTINLENPDEGMEWADLVREVRTGTRVKHALSNSFAFGGSNASVVLSKID
ncbi:MAG: beta-ketoacyl-[Clostridia bacterium]|nr:beta-ketoacyl-[acyl-carrier-protein] synthase family protein [Clostridia bacterium]